MNKKNNFNLTRRSFLKLSGGAAALAGLSLPKGVDAATDRQLSTLIDL